MRRVHGNRLRAGLLSAGGGGAAPFVFQAETTTLAASFAVAPTATRKRTIDRVIRRLKAGGVWSRVTALYMIGLDEDASFKNWKTPGTYDCLKVGTPTFTANDNWVSTGAGNYLNTQMNANVLSQNDCGHYSWVKNPNASTNSRYGAIGATSNGITMASTLSLISGRCASGNNNLSGSSLSDGIGMEGANRNNSADYFGSRNGHNKNTFTTASAALPAQPIYLLTINNNGTASASVFLGNCSMWYFGQSLTQTQERELYGAVGEYLEALTYGEPYIEELGVGASSVSAQCIFYGATAASVLGALQASRAGKTVAICGGWRDRHYGGMSAGGLNWTDFDNHASLGGLPKYIITRMNAIEVRGAETFYFYNATFRKVMRELLNPALNGGFTIPIYWTNGVVSVSKSGTTINSFTTTDGRTFSGSQYFDGSYEGDLMRLAGCSYTYGREAAGTGKELLNGVRDVNTGNSEDASEFYNTAITVIQNVDPWLTPGDTNSGLLAGIQGVRSTFQPGLTTEAVQGTADSRIQAYNFRQTVTNLATNRIPWPSTQPANYDATQYEMLFRYLAVDNTIRTVTIFGQNSLGNSIYDFNSRMGQASDYIGYNWSYPTASYAARETIWQAHKSYLYGLWYTLQYSADARIPAALKTDALNWGLTMNQYWSWHENDGPYFMPQLYVRESIRMVSDVVMNGNDINKTDGTTPPISTKTISTISYTMDSHHTERIAHEVSSGTWRIWNGGNWQQTSGGADQTSPLPIEIAVPKVAECTNLSVGFCFSATHCAFGAVRMEYTAMQVGQSMGQAMAQAITDGSTIQAVNYATVRASLLASASLAGEVAPVLPQLT